MKLVQKIAPAITVKHHLTLAVYLKCLLVWTGLSTSLVAILGLLSGKPVTRAMLLMGSGLVLFWIFICGSIMYRYRNEIKRYILTIPVHWYWKFIIFSTILSLIEEAITTSMTNLAPLFGVAIGQAYITASANYFDVILMHSVIVIAPMFIGWAWLLRRWQFHPNAVLLLFGITGTLAEMSFGGLQHLAEYGMWTFVYGLMVYLPAYCLPQNRGAKPPKWWHYPIAIFFVNLYSIPAAIIMTLLFHHPKIDFPPIVPGT